MISIRSRRGNEKGAFAPLFIGAFPAKVRSSFASDNAKNKEIEHFQ
ncbi:hypothetical protein EDF68_102317 [Ochrobactrum sp. BH3]|nr:hypothetical protein EDF68_102317 [Ochrobactrum sp. BH3]